MPLKLVASALVTVYPHFSPPAAQPSYPVMELAAATRAAETSAHEVEGNVHVKAHEACSGATAFTAAATATASTFASSPGRGTPAHACAAGRHLVAAQLVHAEEEGTRQGSKQEDLVHSARPTQHWLHSAVSDSFPETHDFRHASPDTMQPNAQFCTVDLRSGRGEGGDGLSAQPP